MPRIYSLSMPAAAAAATAAPLTMAQVTRFIGLNQTKLINIINYTQKAKSIINNAKLAERELDIFEFSQLSYLLNVTANNIVYLKKATYAELTPELEDIIAELFPENSNYWHNLTRLTSCHMLNYGDYYKHNKVAITKLFEEDFFANNIAEKLANIIIGHNGPAAISSLHKIIPFAAENITAKDSQFSDYLEFSNAIEHKLAYLNSYVIDCKNDKQIFEHIYLHYMLLDEVVKSGFAANSIKTNLIQIIANLCNELKFNVNDNIVEYVQNSYLYKIILLRNQLSHNINIDFADDFFTDDNMLLFKQAVLKLAKHLNITKMPEFKDVITEPVTSEPEAKDDGFEIVIKKITTKPKGKKAKQAAKAAAKAEQKLLDAEIKKVKAEIAEKDIIVKISVSELTEQFRNICNKLYKASNTAESKTDIEQLIEIFNNPEFDINRFFKLSDGKYHRSFETLIWMYKKHYSDDFLMLKQLIGYSRLADYRFADFERAYNYIVIRSEGKPEELIKWFDEINHPQITSHLVKVCKNMSAKHDKLSYSPLQHAILKGLENTAFKLIGDKIDVNYIDKIGDSALNTAILKDQINILSKLLEFEVKDEVINNALHNACYMGKIDFAKLLIEHGADANSIFSGYTPLLHAFTVNSDKMVEFLLPYSNLEVSNADGVKLIDLILQFKENYHSLVKLHRFLESKPEYEVETVKIAEHIAYLEASDQVEKGFEFTEAVNSILGGGIHIAKGVNPDVATFCKDFKASIDAKLNQPTDEEIAREKLEAARLAVIKAEDAALEAEIPGGIEVGVAGGVVADE